MTKNRIIFLLFISGIFTVYGQDKENEYRGIIAPGAEVEKLAEGFLFTEGPVSDQEGNVFFTDQPSDRIMKWSVDGTLSVFLDNSGRANGLYFDKEGNLISCSDMDNEIWSINEKGEHRVLLSHFNGKKLNGPNDLWIHPNGGIYFTDPLYVRNYWTRDPEMQQAGEYVYYFSVENKEIKPVAIDLEKPNGIVGTPDGKLLYVADIKANKTYVYDIQQDGSLTNKRLFAPLGSDGMTIDREGNIYLTGRGVTVFNSRGERIEHIPVKAGWTANVCFGGKDMDILFITASEYLYGLRMNVTGVR